jgi:transcriptional regulator
MYLPPAFREDRIEVQHALIRAQPLGLLVTAGPAGLMANQLPFLIYPAGSAGWAGSPENAATRGTLRAHFARGNPQLAELAAVEQCLVVFQGPQEYVTPSWYATKHDNGKVVPTWNYVTVHAWGRPRVITDDGWLRRQIGDLTRQQEANRPTPWEVEDAPADFVTAQVKGIVGVEIPIDRIEGKWKVSQNRPAADRAGVVAGLRERGATSEAMAALVAERGGPT